MPPKFGSSAPKCPRCDKSVYANEERKAANSSFHVRCFLCVVCKTGLSSTTVAEHDGEIYCKVCHAKDFGPKGFGYSSTGSFMHTGTKGNVGASAGTAPESDEPRSEIVESANVKPEKAKARPQFGGAPSCPRCAKSVYAAEQVLGPGGSSWHKMCFACNECGKLLSSVTAADRDGQVYCKTCHAKKFGPKGYGFASGAAIFHTE